MQPCQSKLDGTAGLISRLATRAIAEERGYPAYVSSGPRHPHVHQQYTPAGGPSITVPIIEISSGRERSHNPSHLAIIIRFRRPPRPRLTYMHDIGILMHNFR
jgi:hypothetical protein